MKRKQPDNLTPPRWALRFFEFFCKEAYQEQVMGDLYELFSRDHSKRRFGWNVVRFFRWRYLKGLDDFEQLTTLAMLRNYLKISLWALLKQKSYTIINILSLAVALASAMLISVYIAHESSYDNFYENGDRIYKITKRERGKWTPPLLAHVIREEVSQFETATKTSGVGEAIFNINGEILKQNGGIWADQHFFSVFEVPFLAGNPKTALEKPDQVVLTKEIADKYFPLESAMSKIIKIDGEDFIVSGIIKNTPRNTHLPFKYVVANHLDFDNTYYWTGGSGQTYGKLGTNISIVSAAEALKKLYTKYAGPEIIEFTGHATFEAFKKEYPDQVYAYVPHSLASIHLDKPNLSSGNPGSRENIKIFFLISLFILLIACVNYINMSTARSTLRSKEVGIRKTLGSSRKDVVIQFLTESILITFFSLLLAFGLAILALDLFNSITLRMFEVKDLFTSNMILFSLGLVILVGLIAGFYPAIVIARFNPIAALKGGMKLKRKSYLRNALVSFQFATSIFLIAATLVIYLQVDFLKTRDIGIDINKTLVVANGMEVGAKYESFKRQLLASRHVKEVAKASNVPFMGYPDYGYTAVESNTRIDANNFFVEPGFEKILNMKLVEGRFFKPNSLSDTSKVIINEAMVKELGWENSLGKKLKREPLVYEVVGVIKDFNYRSLKGDISPMILRYAADVADVGVWHQRNILVKYEGGDINGMLEDVEETWSTFATDYPFDARFLDDAFNRLYDGERRFGKIFTTFSIFAVFIAFMGLISLTSFILQKKYKEIAVRKVMGASIPSILRLILREFTVLVIIGGIFGLSVAFYWLNEWLNGYVYRIEIAWYLLAMPLTIILLLTWLIVSIRSYRAALSNPTQALKDE